MFSRSRLSLGLTCALALVLAALAWWRFWRPTPEEHKRAPRIALLFVENQTGDPALNWAGGAILDAARLELGQAEQSAVFRAGDAGEAASRQATHLAYGTLEPLRTGGTTGSVRFSFDLEESATRAVVRHVSGQGQVLQAAAALAGLVAPTAGIESLLPAGVANDRAFELFSKREYAGCTTADPLAFWCWEGWAAVTAGAGKRDEALTIIAKGREQSGRMPAFARARLELMEASIRGDEAMRLAALEKLVQADPANLAASADLAAALTANRRFPQAEALYQRILKRNPRQPESWNLLAYTQAWQGHFEQARKSVAQYDKLVPADPNAADSRGEIEWLAGNLKEAEVWFLVSYQRDQKFNAGAAMEKAALCRYLSGDETGARKYSGQYIEDRLKGGDPLAPFHRARWQFLLGESADAEELLRGEMQRGGPDGALSAARLMLVSLREGDVNTARQYAQAVRKLTPRTANPFLTRLSTALAEGDATAVSDGALRLELAAMRLTLRGDFAQAAAAWDAWLALPRGGGDMFAREMKAWCLLRAGRGGEAAGLVKSSWPLLDPDDRLMFDFVVFPNSLFVRAEAAGLRGDAAEARRLYDLYLRYSGETKDRYGQTEKARAASRL